jgi:hypothetical protein
VELDCNFMKPTEYYALLQKSAILTNYYNVMINWQELIGTTEYPTLQKRCRINRCLYNRVQLFLIQGI